jgi:hypothetical protein
VGHYSQEARVNTTPSTTYNPFGWRLAEIADPRTEECRRRDLIESLIVVEAEELALGRRHLTVVHGRPGTLGEGYLASHQAGTLVMVSESRRSLLPPEDVGVRLCRGVSKVFSIAGWGTGRLTSSAAVRGEQLPHV